MDRDATDPKWLRPLRRTTDPRLLFCAHMGALRWRAEAGIRHYLDPLVNVVGYPYL